MASQSNEFSIGVQWNPDGVSVASFVESLTLWNGLTGDLQDSIQLPLLIYFGSWGNDGQHIAVVQSSFGVYDQIDILNLSQPKTDSSPIVLLSDIYLTNIDWKGNTLAGFTYGGIQLWDVPTQQSIINIPLTGSNNFALSPDGSKIAYIQDGVLQIQTVNTPYVAPTPTPIAD